MIGVFSSRRVNGQEKAKQGIGVVERGCQELTESGEGEAFGDASGEEVAAYTRGGCAEGDEARDQVQIHKTQGVAGQSSRGLRQGSRELARALVRRPAYGEGFARHAGGRFVRLRTSLMLGVGFSLPAVLTTEPVTVAATVAHVTAANWYWGPANRWSRHRARGSFPTAQAGRGNGPVTAFARADRDLTAGIS
jgi:hypothetical protein